jgi:tRNA dimethylallyltransferase
MSESSIQTHRAIAILGPTGSGKSTLGMALAERFRGEIVVCDALQVYRRMDIGTAKPGAADRARIAHHMLDLREPVEDFSAGDYLRLGREALHSICGRGNTPFLVGGTGFYFRALTEGFFEGPGRSEELRLRMRRIIARRGAVAIHRALRRVDPEVAARLAPADAERNIRAYEIYLTTGQTMSAWQNRPRDPLQGFRWLKLGILWDRPQLYERIDRRVDEMIRHGFVDEVKSLISAYPPDCHAFKAIGYRQIGAHLRGEWSLGEAIEDIQRESRRYAKRQMTWFRSDSEILWLEASLGEECLFRTATEAVTRFLG